MFYPHNSVILPCDYRSEYSDTQEVYVTCFLLYS